MSYRNDLDALSARKTALEVEVRERQRELADARRLVEEIEARARLPVLDNIRVAAPCTARWGDMTGDDRVRACGDCKKNVYNLSEMTRDEAEALIIEKEGRLCVRYYQRADGMILLKDCAVGVKRRRRRRVIAAGVAASLAGVAGSLANAAFDSTIGYQQLPNERTYPMMGAIAPPPLAPAPARGVEHRGQHITGLMVAPPELHETKGELQREPRRVPPAPPATAIDGDGAHATGVIMISRDAGEPQREPSRSHPAPIGKPQREPSRSHPAPIGKPQPRHHGPR